MFRFLFVALFLALAQGFMVAPRPARTLTRASVAMGAVEDAAATCLEDGCSVDTLADLLKELKAEAKINKAGDPAAEARQQQLFVTIGQLETLNPDADIGEIEKVVSGAARSFQVVKGFEFKGPAIGYSMKPGSTTTAGKSLDY